MKQVIVLDRTDVQNLQRGESLTITVGGTTLTIAYAKRVRNVVEKKGRGK